jgi:translocation and assembly module TamB
MRMTSRRQRPWILLSLFALALSLSVLGMIPVRRLITARMTDLRRYISDEIEKNYGLSISYDSVSPSILKSLELRGLDVKDGQSGKSVLTARRVSIYYRIEKILSGRFDQSLREIRLSGAVLDIDLDRDAALIESIQGIAAPKAGGKPALSFDLPLKVRCRDLSARVGTSAGSIALDKVSADFLLGPSGLNAKLSAQAAYSALKSSPVPSLSFALLAEGQSDIEMANARFLVSVSGRSDFLKLSTQKFIIGLRSREVELQKVPDRSPLDANAKINLDSLDYSASVKMDDYRPSEIFSLIGGYAKLDPWLACGATGSFDISGNLKKRSSDYRIDCDISVPERVFEGNGRISLAAAGDSGSATIRSLNGHNDYGSGEFSGSIDLKTLTPQGALSVDYRKGDFDLSGDFDIERQNGGISVFSENAAFADSKLLAFTLDTRPSQGGLEFEIGSYLEPKNQGAENNAEYSGEALTEIQAPRIQANGSLNFGSAPFAEAAVYLSRVPSAFAYGAAASLTKLPTGAIRGFASDFTLNAEAFISTDFRKYSYNIPQIVLSYDKKAGNYGALSISGGSSSFEASKISFFWNGYTLSGRLGAEIPQNGPMRFSSAFKLDEVPYELSGLFDPEKQFTLSGDYGFTLDGSFEGPDIFFSVGMKDMPLPLAAFTPRLTLNAFGRFRDLGDWDVALNSSSLEQTGGFLPSYARIGFDGSFNARGGSLESISLQDSISELSGRADIVYTLKEDPSFGIDLSLSSKGAESYKAGIRIKKGNLEGELKVDQAPVARLALQSPGGFLNLEAKLSGSLKDPLVDFSGSLSQATYYANTLNAAAKGRYGEGRIELTDFNCKYFIVNLSGGQASYRLADSKLAFNSDCTVALGPKASFKTKLDGTGVVMQGKDFSPSIAGKLSDISIGKIRVPSWPYSLESRAGTYVLDVGKDRYLNASMDPEGDFTLMLDSPLAVRGVADGRITKDTIQADARNVVVDFPVIWGIFGNPIVDFQAGKISADVKVSGSLLDPDFKGIGRAEGFVCQVPGFLKDSFGPIGTDLKVESKDIVATPFRVAAGSGKGNVDIDLSLQMDGWIPSAINLRARTVKNSPVRAAAKVSGFDVVGNADADISIAVSPLETSVSGSVFLQDTSIVMYRAKDVVDVDYGDTDLKVKMKIGFGRKVEFLFPWRNLPIIRTYLEPSSSLTVGFDSAAASYSLKGNTKLRGGEVFWLKRNFYLKEGNILFNENQSFFDPIVNLKAEIRDRDSQGDVLITMKVENTRLSQFKPKFESFPSRNENQILAILGIPKQDAGQEDVASAGWSNVSQSLLSSTSDVLAQFYGVRLFENTVRDTFGLDMFSVRTQVIQKLLLGAVDNTPSLGEYFDNTTLMAGKYIGSDLFLQMMMQLRKRDSSNPSLDSEFSMEWNTPYFKLLWELQPQHWEDLLVTDQTIGIFWSFSY